MPDPKTINPLYNDAFKSDPHPFFAEALRNQPVIRHPEYFTHPVSLFRYDDVKSAFKNWQVFSSEFGGTDDFAEMTLGKALQNIITMDPPRHTTLRRIAQKGFLPTVLNAFRPQAEKIVNECLEHALENDEVDLLNDFAARITINMISTILGLPMSDAPMIRQWTIDIAENVMSQNWVTELEQRRIDTTSRVVGEMSDYFTSYIADRRRKPKDGDIVSVLLEAKVDGVGFSPDEVESMAMLMLLAGNDSTATLIANYVRCMAEFPDQADLVRADAKNITPSIEEVLRFSPSFLSMERMLTETVKIHDQELDAGSIVVLWIAAANRDPRQFEAPDRFDITRKPNGHIAFAYGPHTCLGAPLARMETTIMATEVMRRTSAIELTSEPVLPGNAILNGPLSQNVRFVPR